MRRPTSARTTFADVQSNSVAKGYWIEIAISRTVELLTSISRALAAIGAMIAYSVPQL
jgi:hypothetical protein